MLKNSFIALDFETANKKRTSICSVGMVKVVDNEIVETFYTLVNPHDYFSETNIHVHGTHPEDVKGAPDFKEVFPYMLQFINQLPVVAHNAAFDMGVLHQSLKHLNIAVPSLTYFCSYQLARRTIKAYRYGLKHLMNHYNLNFHGHHDALNDAKACAMITYRLLKHYDSLQSVLQFHGKNLKDRNR